MKNGKLNKNLGVFTAASIVVGSVIGAGVFFKPYAIYQATGGAPGVGILSWIIGGLVSIFAALTFAEIAVRIPKTGGMIEYLSDVFGEIFGFLSGWMQVIIFYPAYLAGYGVKVGSELSEYFGAQFKLPIAIAVIILLVTVNIIGSETAGKIQVVSTVCKLIPLALIMAFGFALGKVNRPVFVPMVGEGKGIGSTVGTVLLAVLFAFEGWTNVGSVAGEMRNPSKDLPKAVIGGVSVITAVYLLINLAYLRVIPADELMYIESPAAAVAGKLFGHFGGTVVKAGIIISVIGAGNGFLMAGSRVAYEMAVKNMLPFSKSFSKLNSGSSPANAVILIGVLGCLFSLTGEFDLLTDLGTFSCWIFYTLTFLCIFKIRKNWPADDDSYKVPLYPVIPALAVLSGVFAIVSQLFLSGTHGRVLSICSVGFTLLGIPFYYVLKRKNKE